MVRKSYHEQYLKIQKNIFEKNNLFWSKLFSNNLKFSLKVYFSFSFTKKLSTNNSNKKKKSRQPGYQRSSKKPYPTKPVPPQQFIQPVQFAQPVQPQAAPQPAAQPRTQLMVQQPVQPPVQHDNFYHGQNASIDLMKMANFGTQMQLNGLTNT